VRAVQRKETAQRKSQRKKESLIILKEKEDELESFRQAAGLKGKRRKTVQGPPSSSIMAHTALANVELSLLPPPSSLPTVLYSNRDVFPTLDPPFSQPASTSQGPSIQVPQSSFTHSHTTQFPNNYTPGSPSYHSEVLLYRGQTDGTQTADSGSMFRGGDALSYAVGYNDSAPNFSFDNTWGGA
jgi:hypothetical protein